MPFPWEGATFYPSGTLSRAEIDAAYTQSGPLGTVYCDRRTVSSATFEPDGLAGKVLWLQPSPSDCRLNGQVTFTNSAAVPDAAASWFDCPAAGRVVLMERAHVFVQPYLTPFNAERRQTAILRIWELTRR